MEMQRGQKAKLSEVTGSQQIEVAVTLAAGPGQTLDISCFGLDAAGKLSDDRYFIYYNQKASPCGSLVTQGARAGYNEVFRIDLPRLPGSVQRLVFTATLDGAGTMATLGSSRVDLLSEGRAVASYAFSGRDFGGEKAIMVAELYLKDVWRFAAVGQGFDGGLSALLAHFGGQEIAPGPAPARPGPPPMPPSEPPRVNLGKVSLDKRGSSQAVNLKKGGGSQPIHINLNWDQPPRPSGFLASIRSSGAVDLDLGCMFRMADGEKGVIQPLGNSFGSRTSSPYIFLDKDDRSGASSDGENMYIYRPDLIDLVVVFAMIYEGTANFTTVNGRLTLREENGSEILIPLNNPESRLKFCAVALIQREGSTVRITKDERYFSGHAECDKNYGFGFRWVAGQK